MASLAVDVVERDVCYPATNVHCEESERDGDIEADGGMTTEDGESRRVRFVVGLWGHRAIGATVEELKEL
jgi:hypothetical protein